MTMTMMVIASQGIKNKAKFRSLAWIWRHHDHDQAKAAGLTLLLLCCVYPWAPLGETLQASTSALERASALLSHAHAATLPSPILSDRMAKHLECVQYRKGCDSFGVVGVRGGVTRVTLQAACFARLEMHASLKNRVYRYSHADGVCRNGGGASGIYTVKYETHACGRRNS